MWCYLFPSFCIGCGEASLFWLCESCRAKWKFVGKKRCLRCAHPAPTVVEYCSFCEDSSIKRLEALSYFTLPCQRSIHRFKYGQCSYTGKILAILLSRKLLSFSSFQKVECVTYVPSPLGKRLFRFFQPAHFLAKEVASSLSKPCVSLLKVKKWWVKDQQRLCREERWENVRSLFMPTLRCRDFRRKRVLLVDDVLTTGATLASAAFALWEGGVKEVYGAVVARVLTGGER